MTVAEPKEKGDSAVVVIPGVQICLLLRRYFEKEKTRTLQTYHGPGRRQKLNEMDFYAEQVAKLEQTLRSEANVTPGLTTTKEV